MSMYATLPWLIPTAILLVVATGYALNRNYIFELGRRAQNLKVFPDTSLDNREQAPKEIGYVNGGQLDNWAFRDALDGLIVYAKELNPDWIVGVHPGGRILSVLISDAIGLPSSHCLFVGTHSMRSKTFKFEPDPNFIANQITGKMLVIDDISRSGDTLRSLRSFLNELNYNGKFELSKISFAVLLIVGELKEFFLRFHPNWAFYKTDDRYYKLPWSDLSARIANAYESRSTGHDYDEAAIELHEKIVSDFGYALGLARSYLENGLSSLDAKIKQLKSA